MNCAPRVVGALLISVFLLSALASPVQAQTVITEPRLTDLNWTAEGSPYQLGGIAYFVDEADTLTIGPGVRVELGAFTYFTMNGSIVVEGIEADPVVFTNLTDDLWSWILIDEDAGEASFTHTIFEEGWVPIFANRDVSLERCTFRTSTPLPGTQVSIGEGIAHISGSTFEITGKSLAILAVNKGSVRVRNSVFRSGTRSAVVLRPLEEAVGNAIVNSTFIGPGTASVAAISIEPAEPLAPTVDIENNIFVGYSIGVSQPESEGEQTSYAVVSHNDFWNTETVATEGVTLVSNMSADPMFVGGDDLRLRPESPVIDEGSRRDEFAEDFEGVPRPLGFGWDLGAYEYAPLCGDGVVNQRTEVCDDGNDSKVDDCLPTCRAPYCGDGVVNRDSEECDDGNVSNSDGCTVRCTLPACGDGIVNGEDEQCDDGNADDLDECTTQCVTTGRGTRNGDVQGATGGCAVAGPAPRGVGVLLLGLLAGLLAARRSRRHCRY